MMFWFWEFAISKNWISTVTARKFGSIAVCPRISFWVFFAKFIIYSILDTFTVVVVLTQTFATQPPCWGCRKKTTDWAAVPRSKSGTGARSHRCSCDQFHIRSNGTSYLSPFPHLSHSILVKYIVLPTPVCGVFCPCYARCIPKQELISQFLKNKTRIRLN